MNAELDQAVDEVASTGCGQCGRSLPRPGVQCECGAFPDVTREEAARELRAPGELSLHRADRAEQDAKDLMFQFMAAVKVPDRLRKLAELEAEAAEVTEALAERVADRERVAQALAGAQEAQARALEPLEECRALGRGAVAKLEDAVRTCQGPRAEWEAGIAIAELRPVLDKYQRAYDEKAAVTASRRLDLEHADLLIAECEIARDQEATARLYLDEVRPSAERMVLLARPLTEYLAELLGDQAARHPQYPGEWANMLGLLHRMAGAAGLLAMAEENAMPRVLEDLTGPLSRAQDVAAVQRRTAVSHLALPPGPGEASMTMTAPNTLY